MRVENIVGNRALKTIAFKGLEGYFAPTERTRPWNDIGRLLLKKMVIYV